MCVKNDCAEFNGAAERRHRLLAVGDGARVVPRGAVRGRAAAHGEGARADLQADQPGLPERHQGV